MQEKLVYQYPDIYEFDADIKTIEKHGQGCRVILDKSYFYPQGGGQPADRGTLNGTPVTDVHEEDGQIVHTLSGTITAGPVHAGLRAAVGDASGITVVELPGADHGYRVAKSSPFSSADLQETLIVEVSRFIRALVGITTS